MSDLPTTRRSKRHPPMPVVADAGACQWCAAPLLHPPGHKKAGEPNARRRWCREGETTCVRDHLIAHRQGHLRRALWARDRGRCAECARQCRRDEWEADHRIPLWSVPETVRLDERLCYWGLANGQTLCGDCHTAKSVRETKERAALRRAAKQAKPT